MANITVSVTDANNITVQLTPVASQTITIDRGVAGNGISSIVPVTISTLQYLRIYYTNGTQADVGPLTSTAYFGETPITIVGNTISLSTVPINKGGTNAITAAAAIQNLLPSYTGNGSKRLGLNSGATALEWVADGGGTVTSVDVSGGTTGLTTSGGPITGSGTITLTGTLALANGGTGQTTAAAAITALTGTQTSGYYLRSNGTNAVLAVNFGLKFLDGFKHCPKDGVGINGQHAILVSNHRLREWRLNLLSNWACVKRRRSLLRHLLNRNIQWACVKGWELIVSHY